VCICVFIQSVMTWHTSWVSKTWCFEENYWLFTQLPLLLAVLLKQSYSRIHFKWSTYIIMITITYTHMDIFAIHDSSCNISWKIYDMVFRLIQVWCRIGTRYRWLAASVTGIWALRVVPAVWPMPDNVARPILISVLGLEMPLCVAQVSRDGVWVLHDKRGLRLLR